jgi:hypothetical protein
VSDKLVAAAKIVGIVVMGPSGAKKLVILDHLSSVSLSDVPSEQQIVAGAQLVATAVDSFLGDDDGGKMVGLVAEVMTKVSSVAADAAAAKAAVEAMCIKVKAALIPSLPAAVDFDCATIFPAADAGVEDYVASANSIAELVRDGIQALQDVDSVAEGDELMTIVVALIDECLGDTAASELLSAVMSETDAPSLPVALVTTLTTLGTAFGVDTTGLSDADVTVQGAAAIRVVTELRSATSSMTGMVGGGRRRGFSVEAMTPEQLLSLARVVGSVYSATQPAGAASDMSEVLELLDRGQAVLDVVR